MVFKSKTQGKFRIYLRDNESLLQDEVLHQFKKSEGKYALDAFLQELNLTYSCRLWHGSRGVFMKIEKSQ